MTEKPQWLDESHESALDSITKALNASFQFASDGNLVIEISGVKYLLRSQEEFQILFSIYIIGEYNIAVPCDFIFIDIGMNVGMTSLFFAAQPNVKKVVGFEPLAETYSCMLDNLRLNPTLTEKIVHYNYGLGGTTRKQVVEYSYKYKGGVGILGLPEDIKVLDDYHNEEIYIRDVGETLDEVITKFSGENFVLKIDCEGAEYEFFRNAKFLGLLDRFKVIMMEYHRFGFESIKDSLEKKGFNVLVLPDPMGINGMLYAARREV